MTTPDGSAQVKAAVRVFDIIDALDEMGDGTLTEIATRLRLPRSTAYDHLTTMVEEGILIKEDKTYRLSLRFLQYGVGARESVGFSEHVRTALNQLAEETGEIAWFLIEERGKGVYLEKAKGTNAVQPYGKIGDYVSLHDIAAGKAVLAQLPDERVWDIIDRHGLPARTEQTITTPERLFEELAEIRERGVAFNDGEAMRRFRAVASPITIEDETYGSIVVSGPKNRLKGDRFRTELPDLVAEIANALELQLRSE